MAALRAFLNSKSHIGDENLFVGAPFHSLMIAQDAGSAIQGPQRGDIFFGTGVSAGAIAGHTRFAAQFHVLMRKR